MYNIYKSFEENLPFVRIKKVELTNFKGVEHGVIEMNCSKEFIPYDTGADILGIYGQNGSGKSSLVQALDTVKGIICGHRMGPDYAAYIDVAAANAKIYIEYEFQYKSGEVAMVSYEVTMEAKENNELDNNADGDLDKPKEKYPFFSNEIIKTNIYADGSIGRIHTIIDTTQGNLLCGKSLEKYYFENDDENVRDELKYLQRRSYDNSQSFVFCNATSETLNKNNTVNGCSKYYEILAELVNYHDNYLYIVGTRGSGLVQLRAGIPIYLPRYNRRRPLLISERTVVSKVLFHDVEKTFVLINDVLKTIIPDLQLSIKGSPTVTAEGKDGMYIKIMSTRGERTFPFEYESDGIIKIVSILVDYIHAFNHGSITLVVDEFDSGVFEYLLGELLQIFEKSGKGQFIFTSHNLRPLEVIDKKYIRFTTADPKNRYYKLKNVGSSNNLRDLYLREVQLGTQDVEIYKRTKSNKISKALKLAGREV